MAKDRGLVWVLGVNALILFGAAALLILVTLLPGQRNAGTFAG